MIDHDKTALGFKVGDFKDLYNTPCNIQKSSLATDDAIWLGIAYPNPIILASNAKKLGYQITETTGWVPFHIPPEVFINTRMHLNRKQVAELIPVLQHFVDTGELPDD